MVVRFVAPLRSTNLLTTNGSQTQTRQEPSGERLASRSGDLLIGSKLALNWE